MRKTIIELLRNFNFARASAENAFCRPLACKRQDLLRNLWSFARGLMLVAATFALVIVTIAVIFVIAPQMRANRAEAYLDSGLAHFRRGDFDNAIVDWEAALRIDPVNAPVFLRLAAVWLAEIAEAYLDNGIAHFHRGDFDLAIADLTQVIRIVPDSADAFFQRGIAHFYRGDFDNAIADWEAVLRIDLDYAPARLNIETARQSRGW